MVKPTSMIVVNSHRKWYLNDRGGTFSVSLDGRRVGSVAPLGKLEMPCTSGTHVVRVRQWWFRSKPTPVEVEEGRVTAVEVEDPSQRPFLRTFVSGFFRPGSMLTLSIAPSEGAHSGQVPDTQSNATEKARVQRDMAISVILQVLGFGALLLAASTRIWGLAVPAIGLIVLGLGFGIRLMASVRRRSGS
jgi:hypothetical protein